MSWILNGPPIDPYVNVIRSFQSNNLHDTFLICHIFEGGWIFLTNMTLWHNYMGRYMTNKQPSDTIKYTVKWLEHVFLTISFYGHVWFWWIHHSSDPVTHMSAGRPTQVSFFTSFYDHKYPIMIISAPDPLYVQCAGFAKSIIRQDAEQKLWDKNSG